MNEILLNKDELHEIWINSIEHHCERDTPYGKAVSKSQCLKFLEWMKQPCLKHKFSCTLEHFNKDGIKVVEKQYWHCLCPECMSETERLFKET